MKRATTSLNDRDDLQVAKSLKPVQCVYDMYGLFYLALDGFLGLPGKFYYLFSAVMLVFTVAVLIYNHKFEKRKIVRLHSLGIAVCAFLAFLFHISLQFTL